jgi:hypothetical protein
MQKVSGFPFHMVYNCTSNAIVQEYFDKTASAMITSSIKPGYTSFWFVIHLIGRYNPSNDNGKS